MGTLNNPMDLMGIIRRRLLLLRHHRRHRQPHPPSLSSIRERKTPTNGSRSKKWAKVRLTEFVT